MLRTEQSYLKSLHNRESSAGVRRYAASDNILCEQYTESFILKPLRCHRFSTVIWKLIADDQRRFQR